MNVADELTRPFWDRCRGRRCINFAPFSLRADVAVVGAGIAGLSVAYEIAVLSLFRCDDSP